MAAFQTETMSGIPFILAQTQNNTIDIGAQVSALLDFVLTPIGFVAAVLGTGTVAVLLVSRVGIHLLAAFIIFLLSMMRLESKWVDNTLIQPLETIRAYSRPLAWALMIALALRVLALPRGRRTVFFIAPVALFLFFEAYYLGMLGIFVDPARSIFGFIGIIATMVVFVMGLPRLMDAEDERPEFLKCLAIAGILFIVANFAQLGLGYSNAVLQGRLAGIAGNPQQFAAVCVVFSIVGCYYFSVSRAGSPLKWLSAICLGILALFVLWSGSRTGAASLVVAVVAYFRTSLGRLALVGLIGTGVLLALTSVFSESLEITDRFFRGGDTRTLVWLAALEEFMKSPIVGQIPFEDTDGLNLTESVYLRTLALMGSIGGLFLLIAILAWVGCTIKVWRIGQRVPALRAESDFVVSSTAFLLIVSIGEGFLLGVFTLFVAFTYLVFGAAAFVLDEGNARLEWDGASESEEMDGEDSRWASPEMAENLDEWADELPASTADGRHAGMSSSTPLVADSASSSPDAPRGG